MGGFSWPIFPRNVYGCAGCAAAPLIIDVRRAGDVAAATAMILGAIRRAADTIGASQIAVTWMRRRCRWVQGA
jgi:hypothetical protein